MKIAHFNFLKIYQLNALKLLQQIHKRKNGKMAVQLRCTDGVPPSHNSNQNGVVLISLVRGLCIYLQCMAGFPIHKLHNGYPVIL